MEIFTKLLKVLGIAKETHNETDNNYIGVFTIEDNKQIAEDVVNDKIAAFMAQMEKRKNG